MAKDRKEQPEALAAFAVSARSKKKVKTTLTATEQTAPIATDSKKKDRAATKVLQEGVTRKSPDDGLAAYQPLKLVALSDPGLEAPLLANVLSSAIFNELLQPEHPMSVSKTQRDSILSFYRFNSFQPFWVTSAGINDKARRTLALLAQAEDEGLNAFEYSTPILESFRVENQTTDAVTLAQFEIGLTAMALRYAEHLHSGRIIPNKLSGYYDLVPPALNLVQVIYHLFSKDNPDLYLASLAPTHPAYRLMRASLAETRAKQQYDEEPVAAGERVKLGHRDARVPIVRERLIKRGFLTEENALAWMLGYPVDDVDDIGKLEETLDIALSKALNAFQANNGLKQTGQIDKATVQALNSHTDERIVKKLALNMERLRWLSRDLGSRHIFVNQAAFELRVIDHEKIVWDTKVIIGKPETQTFVFSDEMENIVVNPYWRVPKSIIKHEMLPELLNDPSYLDRKGFEVVNPQGQTVSSDSVDWWAYGDKIPYDVRQPPGDDNALGKIKFLFPNSHDIYLHDIPAKDLFQDSVRAFSHGCVRVEDPRKLAELVLQRDRAGIDDLIASGRTRAINLPTTIPVHLTYFTAWPDPAGKIAFYPDIYKRDTRLEKALSSIVVAGN